MVNIFWHRSFFLFLFFFTSENPQEDDLIHEMKKIHKIFKNTPLKSKDLSLNPDSIIFPLF